MSTPINDFVKSYSESGTVRFHMPGHKGVRLHGLEPFDITEIKGADYLFEAEGIIAQSEEQTGRCFGSAKTLYSTEGSSLCIKTMLGIVNKCRKNKSEPMLAVAPRNVHKAFINACILLDIRVSWVFPKGGSRSLCSSSVTADDIAAAIDSCDRKPDCVYITSPDYLGYIADIAAVSKVCKSRGVPLICDNAHGAYLNFLEKNLHPMALGADMCCDSAHKTLPCYTGSALLHISENAPEGYAGCAKTVMSLFASTSPSYLIMESLDRCSHYLTGDYREQLAETVRRTSLCKARLTALGWELCGDEPCKITIFAPKKGLSGRDLGEVLRSNNIEPEYTDSGYVVLMVTPFNKESDFAALEAALAKLPVRAPLAYTADPLPVTGAAMSIRSAAFADSELIPVTAAENRICAMTVTSCQPSVPAAVSGEILTREVIELLMRYGIGSVEVVTEK